MHALAVESGGRLHRYLRKHLKHVVLDCIADCSGLIVERFSPGYAGILDDRDLHTLDLVTVPKCLLKSVGEAESQDIVDRRPPQVVVDAEDVRFIECPAQDFVKIPG
jgi:hypothetical protein